LASNNLIPSTKRTRVVNATALGTTTITSSIIDMSGFSGVVFDIAIGASAVAGQLTVFKVQGGQLANGSDMADLAGTHVGPLPDSVSNGLVAIEIAYPTFRYLQLVIARSTQNVAIDSVVATQYWGKRDATPDDTVLGSNLVVSPAYGTA
jgi:hypothetical protein